MSNIVDLDNLNNIEKLKILKSILRNRIDDMKYDFSNLRPGDIDCIKIVTTDGSVYTFTCDDNLSPISKIDDDMIKETYNFKVINKEDCRMINIDSLTPINYEMLAGIYEEVKTLKQSISDLERFAKLLEQMTGHFEDIKSSNPTSFTHFHEELLLTSLVMWLPAILKLIAINLNLRGETDCQEVDEEMKSHRDCVDKQKVELINHNELLEQLTPTCLGFSKSIEKFLLSLNDDSIKKYLTLNQLYDDMIAKSIRYIAVIKAIISKYSKNEFAFNLHLLESMQIEILRQKSIKMGIPIEVKTAHNYDLVVSNTHSAYHNSIKVGIYLQP